MPHAEQSGRVVLVAYHSVNEYVEDRIRVPNIVTPGAFEAQIRYLAATYRLLALAEYIGHLGEGKPLPGRAAVITFDDGYKDNLAIAAPILRKYAVPATFFVITGCIGADKMKWEDELSCLIRRSRVEAVSLALPSGQVCLSLGSGRARLTAIDALVQVLGHLTPAERLRILEQLRQQSRVQCEDRPDVMMKWDDVRQLADMPGFAIGSHSVTHQALSRIPHEHVAFEATRSREQLEQEIGRPVTLFAYPYGDFDRAATAAVRSAGYSGAVTLEYGQNDIRSDPFCLKRVLAPNQTGIRFRAGMQLRTSIFGELLRKSHNTLGRLGRTIVIKKARAQAGTAAPCGS